MTVTLNDNQITAQEALDNLRKVFAETKHMDIEEAMKLRRRAMNRCWAAKSDTSKMWAIMTGQVES